MSAAGVVLIAFAKTGFVLLCTIPSELLTPSRNELIEMFKDYLSHLATQTRRAVVFKILNDIETVRLDPILALPSPFTACTCIGSLPSFDCSSVTGPPVRATTTLASMLNKCPLERPRCSAVFCVTSCASQLFNIPAMLTVRVAKARRY
jgi:hypothetical protein